MGLKKVDLNFEELLIIELKYRVKVGYPACEYVVLIKSCS